MANLGKARFAGIASLGMLVKKHNGLTQLSGAEKIPGDLLVKLLVVNVADFFDSL